MCKEPLPLPEYANRVTPGVGPGVPRVDLWLGTGWLEGCGLASAPVEGRSSASPLMKNGESVQTMKPRGRVVGREGTPDPMGTEDPASPSPALRVSVLVGCSRSVPFVTELKSEALSEFYVVLAN